MFLKQLNTSTSALLELIGQFGAICGYKLNASKSTPMLLNEDERQVADQLVSIFKLSSNFTYVGVKIIPQLEYRLIDR